MDLTQFPEPIQSPLTDLLTSLETIYRDHPTCVIKFLHGVVQLFGPREYREAYSQTERETEITEPAKRSEGTSGENEDDECTEIVEQVWDLKSLAEDVRSVAEQTLSQSSFVYDSQSGTYYNYGQQCYYIPEHKLYYYVQNKAYYTYDEENNCMKFYSCEAQPQNNSGVPEQNNISSDIELTEQSYEGVSSGAAVEGSTIPSKTGVIRIDDELEEGEIVSDDEDYEVTTSSQPVCSPTPTVIIASPKKNDLNVEPKDHCAPCIRLTVRECDSDKLELGRLFIITRSGGTLGREGPHDIVIPDLNVSKEHLTFHYKYKDGLGVYEIIDSCSRNGTLVDGHILQQRKPHKLEHGSFLKVGGTLLLCHIHDGLGTCDECEPSCLGFLSPNSPHQPLSPGPSLKARHAQQIIQIKRKFGLNKNHQVPKLPKGYEDKSKIRRETVGSSHDCEKTETNSVDAPIRSDNKGYEMLSKMGWKEGEGVGKTGEGAVAPINVSVKLSKRGLGCAEADPLPQSHSKNKGKVLEITKKRYDEARE